MPIPMRKKACRWSSTQHRILVIAQQEEAAEALDPAVEVGGGAGGSNKQHWTWGRRALAPVGPYLARRDYKPMWCYGGSWPWRNEGWGRQCGEGSGTDVNGKVSACRFGEGWESWWGMISASVNRGCFAGGVSFFTCLREELLKEYERTNETTSIPTITTAVEF